MENTKKDCTCTIKLSVLEIYQEKLKDLLTPTTSKQSDISALRIREQADGLVWVEGLSEVVVSEADSFNKCISLAMKRRVVGAHSMNAVSSRSHLCCVVSLSAAYGGEHRMNSKLHLVDLAGSETVWSENPV